MGNGKVTCVSLYGGNDVDFGDGRSYAIWIDNLCEGDDASLLQRFKGWFENTEFKKVWHNYSFDRHIMFNEGVNCLGFAGDTMHMARLFDTSRDKSTGKGEGYSLEALSSTFLPANDIKVQKKSIKELFGVPRLLKSGAPSKILELPPIDEIQTNADTRQRWIEYSATDAFATHGIYTELRSLLEKAPWLVGDGNRLGSMFDFYERYLRDFGELLTDMERIGIKVDKTGHLVEAEKSARRDRAEKLDLFYKWVAKRNLCTGDPRFINTASGQHIQTLLFGHFEKQEDGAAISPVANYREFEVDKSEDTIAREREKVLSVNPYALMNAAELKALLKERGHKTGGTKQELMARLMALDDPAGAPVEKAKTPQERFASMTVAQLKVECSRLQLSTTGKKAVLVERLVAHSAASEASSEATSEATAVDGQKVESSADAETAAMEAFARQLNDLYEAEEATKRAALSVVVVPKSYEVFTIRSIGLTPKAFTPTGLPQVSAAILKKLAGQNLFGEKGKYCLLHCSLNGLV